MQIYLLAVNLFALTAWLIGLAGFIGCTRTWRLLPLFLLVVSQSIGLILSLTLLQPDTVATLLGALNVFNAFCLVWALLGSTVDMPSPWHWITWLAAGGAIVLAVGQLWPTWPIPPQISALTVAFFGLPLLVIKYGQGRWLLLSPLLMFALANFLWLLDIMDTARLMSLLSYALFVGAIHQEIMRLNRLGFADRQRAAATLAQQAIDQNRAQQRWLEVSELLSAVPNPAQSMEHITRTMAQITHADQAALLILDNRLDGQVRLLAVYSPERPVHLAYQNNVTFKIENCPLLQQTIDTQQPLWLPVANGYNLSTLYTWWQEERTGPTLIQPLVIKGRPVGALVLGNPVSGRSLRQSDIHLCLHLSTQIAAMVEQRHRYLELEAEAEAITLAAGKQTPTSDQNQTLLELIGEGLVVSDESGRIQWVNHAAEQILGKLRSELLNQPLGTIYGAIDSAEAIETLMVAFARRNQPLPTFKENDDRAIQGRLIPWRGPQGEWKGIIAVFRDVTREVKADQSRNDFIAALSRELRAPLTTIKGYSDLIIHGGCGDYSVEQLRVQQIIHSGADRMTAVLDDAIQITAQNRRKLLSRFEEVNVTELIDQIANQTMPLAKLRELKFFCEVKDKLPPLVADPKHLQQILHNLLSNAGRFTPPGGQIFLRATHQPKATASFERPHLLLMVADTGVGIPRIEQKRIFAPFYQLKNQRADVELGMGMGLTVVKDLVALHHGQVWVESVVGEGSTFYVALPLTQNY
jgi:PAS domain S-box-containing protein